MKKKILAIFTISLSAFTILAQNEIDALRYSTQDNLGTARFSAMGGAFGSLGADFSSLSNNPAGIGMYQFTEFTFTPSFNFNETTSYFGANKHSKFKTGLDIGNLGLVLSTSKKDNDWKRINIGLGWNQLANYDQYIYIDGYNNKSSIADNFLSEAQGNKIDDLNAFHASPAFWTDIIDVSDNSIDSTANWYAQDTGSYISHVYGNKRQIRKITNSGGMHEFVFSVGTSFQERLYLGATLGIPTINFYQKSTHSESEFSDSITGLNSFDYAEELSVYGSGINIKLGAIYRVSDNIKIGGALHSPTFFSIEEEYNTTTTAYFENDKSTEYSPYNYFDYNLITPYKVIISASTVITQIILLTADYEMIDYSLANLYADGYSFNDENNTITDLYSKGENIRLGGEIKLNPFSLRTGYSLNSSPYKNNSDFSSEKYTFGIGINSGSYYFDAAYVLSQSKEEYLMYNEVFIDPIALANTNHSLLFTIGFRY